MFTKLSTYLAIMHTCITVIACGATWYYHSQYTETLQVVTTYRTAVTAYETTLKNLQLQADTFATTASACLKREHDTALSLAHIDDIMQKSQTLDPLTITGGIVDAHTTDQIIDLLNAPLAPTSPSRNTDAIVH